MKILVRLMFLVLIPIIVGLALVLSNVQAGVYVLEFGTVGVMAVLVIVGIILLLTGKLFPKSPDQTEEGNGETDGEANSPKPSQKEREDAAIGAVNSSHFYSSQINLAKYEADHVLEASKHTSKKGMIAVFSIIILLIADVALATVFTIKHIWVGAIVCASIFGGTIIISLITALIREKIALNGDIARAKKITNGKVVSCFMTDTVTTKSVTPTVRIRNVTYRVIVNADGAEYTAVSKQFYETDEEVTIAVMGKKRAKILDKAELEKLNEVEATESRSTEK